MATDQTLKPFLYQDVEYILWPIADAHPWMIPGWFQEVDLFYAHYLSSTQAVGAPYIGADDKVWTPVLKHDQVLAPSLVVGHGLITNPTVQG